MSVRGPVTCVWNASSEHIPVTFFNHLGGYLMRVEGRDKPKVVLLMGASLVIHFGICSCSSTLVHNYKTIIHIYYLVCELSL
jgi:hypothetical protein